MVECKQTERLGIQRAYREIQVPSRDRQRLAECNTHLANLKTMLDAAQALPSAFRETDAGGLGVTMVNC